MDLMKWQMRVLFLLNLIKPIFSNEAAPSLQVRKLVHRGPSDTGEKAVPMPSSGHFNQSLKYSRGTFM